MSVTRISSPENRLVKILDELSGVPASKLIADADRRVVALAGAIRAYVAEQIELLLPYAEVSEDVLFAESPAVGEIALHIAEVAAAAKLDAVGEIARGIAAMIDSLRQSGVWHSDALRVHIRSLLLLNQEAQPGSNKDVLEHLFAMRKSIGVAE